MNFVSTTAKAVGTAAIKHAIAHPYRTTIAAAGIGLGPFLGAGWVIAIPLNALGFGAGGVAGGSVAAWYQSTVYGAYIPPGSVFALLQHLGAVL
ncbi:hypothetical protein V8E51_017776 [Hyaloscypha variabilis]